MTHLNNGLTRHDPFDLLYNKVYKNKTTNLNFKKIILFELSYYFTVEI
jgi:hypothetical protein